MKATRCVALFLALVGCTSSESKDSSKVAPPHGNDTPPVASKQEIKAAPPEREEPLKGAADRAIELLRGGQIDEAIAALDEHLEQHPDAAREKAVLAQALQEKAQPAAKDGRWDVAGPLLLKSAKLAREIRSVKGLNIDTLGLYITATYNEACTYSRLGEIDKALDSLEESLRAGFLDQSVSRGPTTRELFVSDPDLDAIRSHDRFLELKDRYLKEEKLIAPPSHDPSAT